MKDRASRSPRVITARGGALPRKITAGTVATVATVDQFIRHAESGFFGDDEEADCPFVWDGDC